MNARVHTLQSLNEWTINLQSRDFVSIIIRDIILLLPNHPRYRCSLRCLRLESVDFPFLSLPFFAVSKKIRTSRHSIACLSVCWVIPKTKFWQRHHPILAQKKKRYSQEIGIKGRSWHKIVLYLLWYLTWQFTENVVEGLFSSGS